MTEADCTRMQLLLQAEIDGELGVAETANLSVHLAGCAECRKARGELLELSAEIRSQASRFAAPAALRQRLEAKVQPEAKLLTLPLRPRRRWQGPLAAGGALALAASVALALLPNGDNLATQAAASHIRAMQPGHLADVASTDQHTVKPWFAGKLDYTPPVRDFVAAGFPLIGGRLDYLAGRAVAVLVYRHDRHVIDLYVWPGAAGALATTASGYLLRGWSFGGMQFLAVSDLNAGELGEFAELWQASGP